MSWTGALGQWLREEADDQKVESLNHSNKYQTDDLKKDCKERKYMQKEAGDGQFLPLSAVT